MKIRVRTPDEIGLLVQDEETGIAIVISPLVLRDVGPLRAKEIGEEMLRATTRIQRLGARS